MKGTLQSATVFYCRGNSEMHPCHLAVEMTNCPFEHQQEENTRDSLAASLPLGYIHSSQVWRGTWVMLSRSQPCNVDLLLTVAVMSNTHGSVFSFTEVVEYLKLEGAHNDHWVQFPFHSHLWEHVPGIFGTCCDPPPHSRLGTVGRSWRSLLSELFATQAPSQIEKFERVIRENHCLCSGDHTFILFMSQRIAMTLKISIWNIICSTHLILQILEYCIKKLYIN